jgi:predicted glycoside hydrolase/deacetylase ChbG (UPF0249 family)
MAGERFLIVNADDFGLSPGVNRGIIAAHEGGIVTSASLMVRWPAAVAAAAYARAHPNLSVGLHVDLGEWRYVDGAWVPLYEVIAADDAGAVRREIVRQSDSFRRLMGRDPTHVDSHQHAHRSEPARSILIDLANTLATPLRDLSPDVRYLGGFYGQTATGEPLASAITAEALVTLIRDLGPGVTELGCHPGMGDDAGSVYGRERELEVSALCDPRVRDALADEGIRLCSFNDVGSRSHRG